MFAGPLMMLIFAALCFTIVLFIMRGVRHGGRDAVDVLKERFARGEIYQTEFEERRRFLQAL
jgi:uncharacterized membrane protein